MDDVVGFGNGDEDAALLAEMLVLLDEECEHGTDQCRPLVIEQPKPKKPTRSGIGSAARRKLAIDALRMEHQRLSDHVGLLRNTSFDHSRVRERAMAERLRRRRVEHERDALRHALFQHMQFMRGLRGAVSAAGPRTSLGLHLCHYLHNVTRLPRDPTTRQREYTALSRAERLDAAVAMLRHETGHISVVDAHIETDFVRESDTMCASSTVSVFTVESCDVSAVLRAACVATRDILQHSRPSQNVGLHGEIRDVDALGRLPHHHNIQYRATSVRKRPENADDFSVESLEVTMYRLEDEKNAGDDDSSAVAVMLWDFVDHDECAPLGGLAPDISRQNVGACLIRCEPCPNGVDRVVYRELSMRRYLYRGDSPTPPLGVQHYFANKQSSCRPNELVFRDIMVQQVAREAAEATRRAAWSV